MKKHQFFTLTTLLALALACFHFAILKLLSLEWQAIYLSVYLFFPVVTILVHASLMKQVNKRPQAFVTYFMGGMTVKLLSSLGILLVVLYTNREIKIAYTLLFMVYYLAFTVLSVTTLFKALKQKN